MPDITNTGLKNRNLLEWIKLISMTGSAQVLIQAVGLVSGILIVRYLSTQEYALYTIANTMLGTMNVLADGGIATGVMSEGGKVWQDRVELGKVLNTGLDLRKKFAIVSIIVTSPILFYLLIDHGANWKVATFIVICILPGFLSNLSGSLLEIIPRLHQDVAAIQKNQVGVGIGRLIIIALTITLFPFSYIGLVTNGLPQIWSNYNLRKIASQYVSWKQEANLDYRKRIFKIVKRIMPGAIYYVFSGQITIWLISYFGNTTAVAQIGALGRFAMLTNILSIMSNTLIVPRFARYNSNKQYLLIFFLKLQISLFVLSLIIILFTYFFSTQMLFFIGKDYENLSQELLLTMIGGCVSLISGVSFVMCTSRGWVINPMISTLLSITSIVIALILSNINTLSDVLIFNIYTSTINAVMWIFYALYKIVSNQKEIDAQ